MLLVGLILPPVLTVLAAVASYRTRYMEKEQIPIVAMGAVALSFYLTSSDFGVVQAGSLTVTYVVALVPFMKHKNMDSEDRELNAGAVLTILFVLMVGLSWFTLIRPEGFFDLHPLMMLLVLSLALLPYLLCVYIFSRFVIILYLLIDTPIQYLTGNRDEQRGLLHDLARRLAIADSQSSRMDGFDVKTEYHQEDGELEVGVVTYEDSVYEAGAVEVVVNGEVRHKFSRGEGGNSVRLDVEEDDDVSIKKYN